MMYLRTIGLLALCLLMSVPIVAQSEQLQSTNPNGTACRGFDVEPTADDDPNFWVNQFETRLNNADYAWVVENWRDDAPRDVDDGYPIFLLACALWGMGRDGSAEDAFLFALDETDDDDLEDTIIELIGYDPDEREFRPEVDPPEEIDVSEGGESILAQLEATGFIPSGAESQSDLPFVSLTTAGTNFDTYGMDADAINLVMGATLDFDPNGDILEFCAIGGRISRDSAFDILFTERGLATQTTISITDYLLFAVDSLGTVVLIDNDPVNEDLDLEFADDDVDIDEAVQLTMVVLDNRFYGYVNGELAIEENLDRSRGGFAFFLQSGAQNTRCAAENFFAYEIPDHYVFGRCDIVGIGQFNRRGGPSTATAIDGQTVFGEVYEAVGQIEADDGFTWWELDDGAWVREDIVSAQGDCRTLPESDA
ncbi:MAG: hypothetical protein AAFN11_05045 [Chloroflexota bacterium]